ncbi:MAG: hypothetical protein KGQ41_08015 [Alphaproteobacteria bacterium]|nr:hypothetical protein [Alphaproteobacteria bacterium]
MYHRSITVPAASLALLFSAFGAHAGPRNDKAEPLADPASIEACMKHNTGMINFIVTRTLVPKPSMDISRLYRSSSGTLSDAVVSADGEANPIILQAGNVYVELRADGQQEKSTHTLLRALCEADPKLSLPDQFKQQVMAWLDPPESLIDIDARNARATRDLRHKYRDNGGASGIPSYIDRPKAP